ncbi:hypothetical protein J1P26_20450 [Neobacillus sp. MM2021_6]|uniref:hypothetical protein n=1 Tax=Bacillaceae TaxID=186817 RepID=UPI00140DB9D5|nr:MULTISPECIES: hypothetical protein [Bacillaceae]MBO0962081.1 hypothetical protein [Neobacillus sp. MM2021_6]NHC19988.1 hypothetical protein [Bacillus sp. MM2020_4]
MEKEMEADTIRKAQAPCSAAYGLELEQSIKKRHGWRLLFVYRNSLLKIEKNVII